MRKEKNTILFSMKNQKSGKDKMRFIHEMRNFGLMLPRLSLHGKWQRQNQNAQRGFAAINER
jgi:hypothetical protein